MRPIRLEIRGFTAFREPQVVDFDGLDLFAITGPTGSGKSSILDALTFVLYGRAERVGDGVRQLVSQGAATRGRRPRVRGGRRTLPGRPERDRGRQDEDPRRARPIRPPSPAGARPVTAPTGSARPTRRIEKLVGLDYAGFTRAVLLPQGRFAEFLAGDAKTRRKILADLLDLGLFERVAAKAGELARTLGGEVTGPGRHPRGRVSPRRPTTGSRPPGRSVLAAEALAARLAVARETDAGLLARSVGPRTRGRRARSRRAPRRRATAEQGTGRGGTRSRRLVEAIARADVGHSAADRDPPASAPRPCRRPPPGRWPTPRSTWGDAVGARRPARASASRWSPGGLPWPTAGPRWPGWRRPSHRPRRRPLASATAATEAADARTRRTGRPSARPSTRSRPRGRPIGSRRSTPGCRSAIRVRSAGDRSSRCRTGTARPS